MLLCVETIQKSKDNIEHRKAHFIKKLKKVKRKAFCEQILLKKSKDTIDNSREALITKQKDKKTSLYAVDTIEKSEDTISNSREPLIKK